MPVMCLRQHGHIPFLCMCHWRLSISYKYNTPRHICTCGGIQSVNTAITQKRHVYTLKVSLLILGNMKADRRATHQICFMQQRRDVSG